MFTDHFKVWELLLFDRRQQQLLIQAEPTALSNSRRLISISSVSYLEKFPVESSLKTHLIWFNLI